MAIFTASAAQSFSPAIYRENATISRTVRFTPPTAASIGDVLQMVRIPNTAVVNWVGVSVSLSAGALVVNVGDGNDTSAFAASTVLSGAGVQVLQVSMPFRGVGRSYSAEDTIDIQIIAGTSAPPTSADYKLTVNYTCQNDTQG